MEKTRTDCLIGLISALMARASLWLAARHLERGYPQLAAFSFDHIGARINAFGRYEHDELATLAEFLRERGLLGGACLDIGANIGNHAVFFADLYPVVHAFEPAPRPFALLQANSCLRPNILCHRIGLSDLAGVATLRAPRGNIGEGTVERVLSARDGDCVDVPLVRMDDFAPVSELQVGLVKIDVEGHEAQVIDGARSTLSRHRPVIVFEQQPEKIFGGTSEVIERLRALGYRDFYEFAREPRIRFRPANIIWRLLRGERCRFQRIDVFEQKYYGMLVAVA